MRGLSLVAASGGHSSSRWAGLSLSRPLLLRSTGSRRAGSVVVAHGPSCSATCGIFPDQGSNPCPLHWQADSQLLHHQGSPVEVSFTKADTKPCAYVWLVCIVCLTAFNKRCCIKNQVNSQIWFWNRHSMLFSLTLLQQSLKIKWMMIEQSLYGKILIILMFCFLSQMDRDCFCPKGYKIAGKSSKYLSIIFAS